MQGINLRPQDAEDVVCEKCGCRYFREVYAFKRIKGLLIGKSEDEIIPINTFACSECGHINKGFEIQESPKKEDKSGIIV